MKTSPAPWHHGYPGGIFDADGKSIIMVRDLGDWKLRDANALLVENAPVMLNLLRALLPYVPEESRPKLEWFLKKFD